MKSLNSSGHKRSRLPVVQGKPLLPNNPQFPPANNYALSYNQYTSSTNNTAPNEFKGGSHNISTGQHQLFTRRNLFHPQTQQFHPQWTANPTSEEGEVESQGQESVRKFCTEDTPVSLSKAGSNTNLSSLTFDDEDHSTTPHTKYDTQSTGERNIIVSPISITINKNREYIYLIL